jgi:hypothetical protein
MNRKRKWYPKPGMLQTPKEAVFVVIIVPKGSSLSVPCISPLGGGRARASTGAMVSMSNHHPRRSVAQNGARQNLLLDHPCLQPAEESPCSLWCALCTACGAEYRQALNARRQHSSSSSISTLVPAARRRDQMVETWTQSRAWTTTG